MAKVLTWPDYVNPLTLEAVISLGWNSDASALIAQGVPIRYVVPREGS